MQQQTKDEDVRATKKQVMKESCSEEDENVVKHRN